MLNTVRHVAMKKHTLLICSKSCKGVRGWVHPKWHSIGPSIMPNMRCQAFGEESNSGDTGMIPEEDMLIDSTGIRLYQQVHGRWSEDDGKGPTSTWENLNQWFWGVDFTRSSSSSTWEL